jgi:hypothetical protein
MIPQHANASRRRRARALSAQAPRRIHREERGLRVWLGAEHDACSRPTPKVVLFVACLLTDNRPRIWRAAAALIPGGDGRSTAALLGIGRIVLRDALGQPAAHAYAGCHPSVPARATARTTASTAVSASTMIADWTPSRRAMVMRQRSSPVSGAWNDSSFAVQHSSSKARRSQMLGSMAAIGWFAGENTPWACEDRIRAMMKRI